MRHKTAEELVLVWWEAEMRELGPATASYWAEKLQHLAQLVSECPAAKQTAKKEAEPFFELAQAASDAVAPLFAFALIVLPHGPGQTIRNETAQIARRLKAALAHPLVQRGLTTPGTQTPPPIPHPQRRSP